MFTGMKVLGGATLSLAVLLSTQAPAGAQPPAKGGAADVAALEAQLALLKRMTAEVEEKLKDAKAAQTKGGFGRFNPMGMRGFGKGGFGPKGGFGKMDEKKMAEMKERFETQFGRKGPRGDWKGPKGDWKGPKGEKGPDRKVEERLERLIKEIEEIRRSLKK